MVEPGIFARMHFDRRAKFGCFLLTMSVCIYTMFHKETTRYLIAHNFGKC